MKEKDLARARARARARAAAITAAYVAYLLVRDAGNYTKIRSDGRTAIGLRVD